MPYKLSAILKSHGSDVRGLASPHDDLVLSASRDTTAIEWRRSSPNQFTQESLFKASTRYVNSVAYIHPTSHEELGYVVTGGQDSVINVFSLSSHKDDPDFSLLGHTDNVCALDVTKVGDTIVSGSWDRTAKVWKNFSLVYDLKGHQQAVWAVLALEEKDQFLTGSADKTVKLWQQHKSVFTYTGHNDAVRGLARVPDIGFASCSNDSEIRICTLDGDLLYTLSGHTSFVYSLSVLPDGGIISGGEDRTVRIWRDGELSQTIVHPAISVWAVSTMPNGDIVSGCSDGVVRVFSEAEERWASSNDLRAYDDLVASQALPSHQVGDVKKSDLPGVEALSLPGKKSGEVKMVKNGEIVEAHQWDSAAGVWQKIGDVVDAVGQGRKQLYQGKEYDYVFDVDIQDGVPPLKLPYNVTENPFSAAQRFLQSNDLPLTYIDEVVKFIEKNTSGVNIGTGEEYMDPFTGASRYRSAPASVPTPAPTEYADPFTGASRYRANPSAPSQVSASQYSDPFTGASRYTAAPKILPVSKPTTFKQANVSAMQGKLFQFDEAFRNEISASSLAMYPDEIGKVDEIFNYLSQVSTTPSKQPSTVITTEHIEAVIQILDRWPVSQRFPVIDLSRLLVAFCASAFNNVTKDVFFGALLKAAEWTSPWSAPLPKPRETNILLLLRTIANAFQDQSFIEGSWVGQILEALSQVPYGALTKTQRVVFATILFNISCITIQIPLNDGMSAQYLSLILKVLESETSDSEAAYRTLVALGNLLHADKSRGTSPDKARVGEITQCIRAIPTAFPEDRVRTITAEIEWLL